MERLIHRARDCGAVLSVYIVCIVSMGFATVECRHSGRGRVRRMHTVGKRCPLRVISGPSSAVSMNASWDLLGDARHIIGGPIGSSLRHAIPSQLK